MFVLRYMSPPSHVRCRIMQHCRLMLKIREETRLSSFVFGVSRPFEAAQPSADPLEVQGSQVENV